MDFPSVSRFKPTQKGFALKRTPHDVHPPKIAEIPLGSSCNIESKREIMGKSQGAPKADLSSHLEDGEAICLA